MIWINRKTDPRTDPAAAFQNEAMLTGQFAGDGTANEWWFGYGTKSAQGITGYQKATPVESSSVEGNVKVDAPASKLTSNTKYYARLFIRTEDGEVEEGAEISFTTRTRPVAAYSFDAGEGVVAEDILGEHDGAIEGATWFDHGRYGKALEFDGEAGEQVTIADSDDLDFTDEFTLEAWVRPTEAIEWSSILTKERGAGISYQLVAHGDHNAPVGYVANAEKEWGVDGGTTPIPAKVWTHLAFTSDGGRLRFYVNGQLKGSDSAIIAAAGTGSLVIGGGIEGEIFKGLIDEVRVYNRALDAGEIAIDRAGPISN